MKYFFVIFFITASLNGRAQYILFLKGGDQIEYKSIKERDDRVEIKTTAGEVIKSAQDVLGYFNKAEDKFYFRKLLSSSGFDYFTQSVEGPIAVYEKIVQSYNRGGVNSGYYTATTTYYLEKEGWFREASHELVKSFISDYDSLLNRLESKERKAVFGRYKEIANEYNLANYQKEQGRGPLSSVFFFSRIKRSQTEEISLSVNDTIEYKIPSNRAISIRLPTEGYSKVCVSSNGKSECEIMQGSPYSIKYYEAIFNGELQKIKLERTTTQEAQKYLQFVLKSKK